MLTTQFEGQKLTEIINTTHVNRKYLPDVELPENVVAIPDLVEAVKGATALVFVMPHQCERTSQHTFGLRSNCSLRKHP